MMTRQDVIYYLSLAGLFYGLYLVYGLGKALIVLGSVGVGVSILSSFYVTWLSSKGMTDAAKTK
jgi:hypothetical protein